MLEIFSLGKPFRYWANGKADVNNRLSGKPGSGKSTLMKYVSTEFREFCHSNAVLSPWADGENLVACSFFFWNVGSPLQKTTLVF